MASMVLGAGGPCEEQSPRHLEVEALVFVVINHSFVEVEVIMCYRWATQMVEVLVMLNFASGELVVQL